MASISTALVHFFQEVTVIARRCFPAEAISSFFGAGFPTGMEIATLAQNARSQ